MFSLTTNNWVMFLKSRYLLNLSFLFEAEWCGRKSSIQDWETRILTYKLCSFINNGEHSTSQPNPELLFPQLEKICYNALQHISQVNSRLKGDALGNCFRNWDTVYKCDFTINIIFHKSLSLNETFEINIQRKT